MHWRSSCRWCYSQNSMASIHNEASHTRTFECHVSLRKNRKLEIFTSSVSYLSVFLFLFFMLDFEVILYLNFYI
jgi:hypothetical protein